MTNHGSLETRRRDIRDTLLPRALARVGREAVAAHVQLPSHRALVDSLKSIETDLKSLSRIQSPTQEEIEQYYVLRRQRRAGYAEFGEAVLNQLPSEAMPNTFEAAVRKCRAIRDELRTLDAKTKEMKKAAKRAPEAEFTESNRNQSPQVEEPAPVLSISASPPPPSAFDVQNIPDFGEPLHIPHSVYVPPFYKRIYYSLLNAWEFLQPLYGATIIALLVCLATLLTYRAVQTSLLKSGAEEPSVETVARVEQDEGIDAIEDSTGAVGDAAAEGATWPIIDQRTVVLLGVLNFAGVVFWLFRRARIRAGGGGTVTLETGGSLRTVDPTQSSAKAKKDWKTPWGSAVTVDDDEPIVESALERPVRSGVRWLLPLFILLNIGIVAFMRTPPPAPVAEDSGMLTSDAADSANIAVSTNPAEEYDWLRSTGSAGRSTRPRASDRLVLIANPRNPIRFHDRTTGETQLVDNVSVLYVMGGQPSKVPTEHRAGILKQTASNADELEAYVKHIVFQLAAQTGGKKAASDSRYCVAVIPISPVRDTGNGRRALTAAPGSAATLADLISQFGAPDDHVTARDNVARVLGVYLPARWWGDVGVTVRNGGAIAHVLIRKQIGPHAFGD